jgi:hypothetical protein
VTTWSANAKRAGLNGDKARDSSHISYRSDGRTIPPPPPTTGR